MSKLEVIHLRKEFPTRTEPLVVLDDCVFTLENAENLAIIGPSGSGKSTLLSILGTIEKPTSGHFLLDDFDPLVLPPDQQALFRRRKIGFVFQDHHLMPQCSALENVLLPVLASGKVGSSDEKRATKLLERVGLLARLHHRPAELSGGERQRVAIARGLIQSPALLLADEPTGNLDQQTAKSVADLIFELQKEEKVLLIVVTHDLRLAKQMDHCLRMEQGQLMESNIND